LRKKIAVFDDVDFQNYAKNRFLKIETSSFLLKKIGLSRLISQVAISAPLLKKLPKI